MQLFNAMDLKSGKKSDRHSMGTLSQPVQFLCDKEKDDEWIAWSMNWHEAEGLKQLKRNSRRLLKNIKVSKGIIDKTDYIIEDDNEVADLIDTLTREDETALELKFYPIIPNIVNTLCNEFAKRKSKIIYTATDDTSYNEMLEEKRAMVEETLINNARQKILMRQMQMGIDPQSEEGQAEMDPEKIKTLPQIEEYFKKSYRSMTEEWATHQHHVDVERFRMSEMEETGFRSLLTTDREFWHFRMMEDDYQIEMWNPLLTFYHKAPGERYVSKGNYIGMCELVTPADVLDMDGYKMTLEQMESLSRFYPQRAAGYMMEGIQNDGGFYDATKSHKWNTEGPSLAMRQYTSAAKQNGATGDIVEDILSHSEDMLDHSNEDFLRRTTLYWKTQRKLGHLTKIGDLGEKIQEIITEDYKVTTAAIYDQTIYKIKDKTTLIYGEHIDWIWINETWGGIKIGPSTPFFPTGDDGDQLECIFLGINGGKPGRLPFQFKGDNSLYGCKLPVEGMISNDYNTKSVSMVDLLKPFQIGYNVVNNQIADILVDELGTVIMLDQNAIPRHSMGEDWGKGNLAKAYVAMKNYSMLALDTGINNTENALNFQHYSVLNLEQSNRLLSRVNLAKYFKEQAYELIGVNQQKMAQNLTQQTATGVEVAVEASQAQTEGYFTVHSDYLMPRVHQMRTDLAQYYHSTKPSVRLQYVTSEDEKVNFAINGTKLLTRDLNVFCTTKINSREMMEKLRTLALQNNTTGATIFDLGNVVKADSVAELTHVLKEAERKANAIREQEQAHQQELEDKRIAAMEKEKLEARMHESEENRLNRQSQILEAEIRATTVIGANKADMDGNAQNDQIDAMNEIQKQGNYQEQMNFKREQEINKNIQNQNDGQIKREEMNLRREISKDSLQVARENKNKYDKKTPAKK